MLTYILNESLLKSNPKLQIKVNSVNQDDDNDSNDNETLDEKLAKLESLKEMTNDQILKAYRIMIATDDESRIADESTFIISMLQAKLDKSKVENFYTLNRLSD